MRTNILTARVRRYLYGYLHFFLWLFKFFFSRLEAHQTVILFRKWLDMELMRATTHLIFFAFSQDCVSSKVENLYVNIY